MVMLILGVVLLPFLDLEIHHAEPWPEIQSMTMGMLQPIFLPWEELLEIVAHTLAFAFQGVLCAVFTGFLLSLCFVLPGLRAFAAFIRAIHELFWALLFMQFLGLSPLTGFLAIWIPYSGFFAKVFSEIFEECDRSPEQSLNPSASLWSRWVYTTFMQSLPKLKQYVSYRMECGLRSSAVLGFVGLPTMGYELETFFRQGQYGESSALLIIFFVLIATLKYWFRWVLLPIYLMLSFWYLPPHVEVTFSLFWSFVSVDLWPKSLRAGDFVAFGGWLMDLWREEAQEGICNSLILGHWATLLTGTLALGLFPFRSSLFFGKSFRGLAHLLLVITRSLPEVLLAFVVLLIMGPSMLPALVALSLHNGAIIAHLMALQSEVLVLREDACVGIHRFAFEVVPRMYGQFLAFLFYRWEMIFRETAILGMLGIPTLGFFIDSAFEDIRYDRAFFLILFSAALNMMADGLSLYLRHHLHLKHRPESI
jgi:phosphonate transport system permease protein